MTFLVSEASCFLEGRDYSNETGGQTKRLSAVSGPGRRQAKPQPTRTPNRCALLAVLVVGDFGGYA